MRLTIEAAVYLTLGWDRTVGGWGGVGGVGWGWGGGGVFGNRHF
jgi:hypothetical protein